MPEPACTLDGRSLTVADVVRVARTPGPGPRRSRGARGALLGSRRLVEAAIASGQTIYGINTGFGKLANVRVAPDQLDQLQVNLIRSHAAGVGAPLPAAGGAGGHAAPGQRAAPARPAASAGAGGGPGGDAQRRRGAAGAGAGKRRGQRRPRAAQPHRAGADGRGRGARRPAAAAPARRGTRCGRTRAVRFAPKEGLAFINGTQAQTALLALLVHDAPRAVAHRGRRRGDEPRGAPGHAGAARSPDSRGAPASGPDPRPPR